MHEKATLYLIAALLVFGYSYDMTIFYGSAAGMLLGTSIAYYIFAYLDYKQKEKASESIRNAYLHLGSMNTDEDCECRYCLKKNKEF